MWYALGIMEHFRMEHCLDIVLEVLRQDLDFLLIFYFGLFCMKQCCLPLPINWDRINLDVFDGLYERARTASYV